MHYLIKNIDVKEDYPSTVIILFNEEEKRDDFKTHTGTFPYMAHSMSHCIIQIWSKYIPKTNT